MAKLDWRPWPLRVTWALLPLVLGPLLADALDPRDELFRRGVSVALWALWALALLATAVPRPLTLTLVRIVIPASCGAALWAALAHGAHTNSAVGLVGAVVAAVCALLPTTGDAFVDGASYGDERRFLLRPPGAYLLGPIEFGWAIVVAGMDGALPSVIAGLVSTPVIAVPTSVGYGASFGGIAALLSMLNSCATCINSSTPKASITYQGRLILLAPGIF